MFFVLFCIMNAKLHFTSKLISFLFMFGKFDEMHIIHSFISIILIRPPHFPTP